MQCLTFVHEKNKVNKIYDMNEKWFTESLCTSFHSSLLTNAVWILYHPDFSAQTQHWIQKRERKENEGPVLRKHQMKGLFPTWRTWKLIYLFFCISTIFHSDTVWRTHRQRGWICTCRCYAIDVLYSFNALLLRKSTQCTALHHNSRLISLLTTPEWILVLTLHF